MKKIAIVALLSACVATPAWAVDNTGKFYGAIDLGYTALNNSSAINGSTWGPTPGTVRLAGGYNFSENWAVEVGYAQSAKSTYNSTVLGIGSGAEVGQNSSLQVAAVGILPVSEAFSLFAKLGLANNRTDYTMTSNYGASVAGVGSSTSLLTGIGVQYNINRKFALRVQSESFGHNQIGPGSGVRISTSMTSIGGVYTF